MLWNVVLEKTLESPLDCKEIQSVHPKGDQDTTELNWMCYQGRALKIREGAIVGVCGRGNPGVAVQVPWGSNMVCVEGT